VDCAEIRQEFLTGNVPSGPSLAGHLRSCPHCAELFVNQAALGRHLARAAPELRDDAQRFSVQLASAEAAILREHGLRAFLRSRSTRMRWVLSLSVTALLLLRELARGRVPWRSLGSPRLLGGVVLVALLALVTRTALRPLPIERRAARLRWVLALVAWCLPCLMWFVPEAQGSEDFTGSFALRSLACFAYGSALAAPSFVLLWALDRGQWVPFRVWALGAGVVALAANLILLLHCPLTNRAHLVAGHFSIGLSWFVAVSMGEWWRRRA
jgi:hypothetical protein